MLTRFEDFDRLGVPCLLDIETNRVWVSGMVVCNIFKWDRLKDRLKSKSFTGFIEYLGLQGTIEFVPVTLIDVAGRPNTIKVVSSETFDLLCAWAYSAYKKHNVYPNMTQSAKTYAAAYHHHCNLLAKDKKKNGVVRQEGIIRDRLAKELNGLTEVACPVGRIDVLTATEVIEVKVVKHWKSAIGQALSYKYFYPEHTPRIHLYKKTTKENKVNIETIGTFYKVKVTWE